MRDKDAAGGDRRRDRVDERTGRAVTVGGGCGGGGLDEYPSAGGVASRFLGRQSLYGVRAGPVAQLDRASPSEGEGRTFESCRVRQWFQSVSLQLRLTYKKPR